MDDLDLNPLLVQADPGENPRYCKNKIINKVPETIDEKIWSDIENKIQITKQNNFEYEVKILLGQLVQEYHIIFIKNLVMIN